MFRILKRAQLWFYAYGWAAVMVVWFSTRRQRMSHNNGITAKGRLRITDTPAFPEHDFFQPGREFECRLRHASVTYDDDTITQVRGASLKFADSDYESPLDLEMNTGTISPFWTARIFMDFVKKNDPPVNDLPAALYYKDWERGLVAAKDGVRKNPVSFTQLHYHSQTVLRFVGKDGVERYVKYRLVPADGAPEVGFLSPEETSGLWKEKVADGETRSPIYLREELTERISRGTANYRLQLQLHTPQPGESEEILNSNVAWDEATHPFMDLATVRLESVLPPERSDRMRFSMNHHPPSLGLLPSESIDDYNSIVYLRSKTDLPKRARLFFISRLGLRKPLPAMRTVPRGN